MKRSGAIGTLGRAPVPEWEEVARAAWPGRLPRALFSVAGRAYLPVLGLSLAILLGAAWLRLPWLGFAAWTVGAATEWLATPADTNAVRLLDLVGLRAQLRALLRSLVASSLLFASGAGVPAGLGYVTAVLFIQLAWTAQPVLATWLSRSAPPLRYTPGTPGQPHPFAAHARVYARAVGTPGALTALEFVVLAKALAVAAGMLDTVLDLALAGVVVAAALAYLAGTVLRALALHRNQRGWGEELVAEITRLSPAYLVYVSLAARQSKYIVNQWLPALDALPVNGLLLVREASQLAPLAVTPVPVVYAPTNRDVERLALPTVRAAFYLAYGERNLQMLRYGRLAHVLLAHGDSDKAASANNSARAFTEIWVAGQAAIDRFRAGGVNLPDAYFTVIGRPQVSGLPVGASPRTRPVILYAPTFEGYDQRNSYSSLATMGPALVSRLVAGHPEVDVWFRPHPASGTQQGSMLAAIADIERVLTASPGAHVVGSGLDVAECLRNADVLITDISAIASDFLFTERPLVVCNPSGMDPDAFAAAYPSQASSYLLDPGLAGLDTILEQALGDDPLRESRIAMKRYVLGDPPGGPVAAFVANVARVTGSGAPDATVDQPPTERIH